MTPIKSLITLTALLATPLAATAESPMRAPKHKLSKRHQVKMQPVRPLRAKTLPAPKQKYMAKRPGYVAVQGHYVMQRGRYVWKRGYYLRAKAGFAYQQGSYIKRGNAFVFKPGKFVRVRRYQKFVPGKWTYTRAGWNYQPGKVVAVAKPRPTPVVTPRPRPRPRPVATPVASNTLDHLSRQELMDLLLALLIGNG